MANRNYLSKFSYSFRGMPVQLDCAVSFGASGAPTLGSSSPGIQSISRLSAGVYQVQFSDNYNKIISMDSKFESPVSGSVIAGGSFITNTIYQIISLGSTTQAQWVAAGLPSNLTAAVGQIFKAAGAGAGSGTAQALGVSGITSTEIIGLPNSELVSNNPTPGNGGYMYFQCLGPTSAGSTVQIPTDPANGSRVRLRFSLNNSSVQ